MKIEILRMQDVSVGDFEPYGLKDFNLHICEGEMINIIGLSGAGKTTLYQYFLGRFPLKKGKVIYNGRVTEKEERFSDVTDVVCLGQESTLIPGLSIAENIFIITGKRKVRGLIRMKNIYYRVKILLAQYAPELSPHTLIRDLSEVEHRMVELLRAIENEAKLVVIDDVFQGYGQKDILRILKLMKDLKDKKISIIYESHELDFTKPLVDKMVILRKGGNVRTLFEEDYNHLLCQKLMTGKEELPVFERRTQMTHKLVFQVQQLTGEKYVYSPLNIEAHEGEIVGLYDLNNRKNIEFLQMIIGESAVKEGSMFLEGKRYQPKNLDYAIANNIGFIPLNMAEVSLVETMNFTENLFLPVLKKTSHLKIFRNRRVGQFLGRKYMEELGIPHEERDKKVKNFDTYIQKNILLTRWVLFKPRLMVCMEPCGNADMIMKDTVYKTLSEMAGDGTAVLIASQNMNELKKICDAIYVMNSDENSVCVKYDINS